MNRGAWGCKVGHDQATEHTQRRCCFGENPESLKFSKSLNFPEGYLKSVEGCERWPSQASRGSWLPVKAW